MDRGRGKGNYGAEGGSNSLPILQPWNRNTNELQTSRDQVSNSLSNRRIQKTAARVLGIRSLWQEQPQRDSSKVRRLIYLTLPSSDFGTSTVNSSVFSGSRSMCDEPSLYGTFQHSIQPEFEAR